MATIRLTGHIDENGRIEITERVNLPPGDVILVLENVSPEDEAIAEARWQASFEGKGCVAQQKSRSPGVLK